jgi:hypothetical protein
MQAGRIKDKFRVRSLESIGTRETDFDLGVVRVSGALLRKLGKRNILLRISRFEKNGKSRKSIVRLVRAATGQRGLLKHEIALQYDDRAELGIRKAGTEHDIELTPISKWIGLPCFLLGHPSPLVRSETIFAIAIAIGALVIGYLLGVASK